MLIGLPGLVQIKLFLYFFWELASSIPTHFWSLRIKQQAIQNRRAGELFLTARGLLAGQHRSFSSEPGDRGDVRPRTRKATPAMTCCLRGGS